MIRKSDPRGPGMLVRRAVRGVLTAALSAVVFPLLYLTVPFFRLRIVELTASALGHLVGNVDLHLRRRKLGRYDGDEVFVIFCDRAANQAVQRMIARHVLLVSDLTLNRLFVLVAPILVRTRFHEPLVMTDAMYRDYSSTGAVLGLTRQEEAHGVELLNRAGLGPEDWFVCIHARDPGFHQVVRRNLDSSYHDYRNSDINRYDLAASHILERGGKVVRFGRHMQAELRFGGEGVFDLANCEDDLTEVYLAARTRFMLCGNSGVCHLALMFDTPFAMTNMVPYGDLPGRLNALYIPKLLRDRSSGEILDFRRLLEAGLIRGGRSGRLEYSLHVTETYEKLGLEWVENTADDIRDLCLDMFDMVDGREPPPGGREAQIHYRETFLSHIEGREYAGQLGPRFALKYRDLMV